jgi:uncharacterized protein (TIGR00251 family)
MNINQAQDGTTLKVFVKPNSPKFKIEFNNEEIVIYSTEEPVKGKVNREIVKNLSKMLSFEVEIISGLASKQKILLLKDAKKETVEANLRSIANIQL